MARSFEASEAGKTDQQLDAGGGIDRGRVNPCPQAYTMRCWATDVRLPIVVFP